MLDICLSYLFFSQTESEKPEKNHIIKKSFERQFQFFDMKEFRYIGQ